MSARAQIAILPDGRRHFHDGPIDLILEAFGDARGAAYDAAAARFVTILDELCRELPRLRARSGAHPQGVVAQRMVEAVAPFAAERFITPMAAVAGAVAEAVLAAMVEVASLERAYVNNGGDIALHLDRWPAAPSPLAGERNSHPDSAARIRLTPTFSGKGRGGREPSFSIGLVSRPDQPTMFGRAQITAGDAARGLATSGWRGRSFSLGIADAVTVIARTAAQADAAATLIANAIDLPGHPAIARVPARSRDPQSDLGERLVTLGVGRLSGREMAEALDGGAAEARFWLSRGLIEAAALSLNGQTRIVAADPGLFAPTITEPLYAVG